MQVDPYDAAKTALVVGGSMGNDRIDFVAVDASTIRATLNGTSLGLFSPTGRIIAYGQAGNDVISVGERHQPVRGTPWRRRQRQAQRWRWRRHPAG